MSFRIDDILRKDDKCATPSDDGSILQQTLLNKPPPYQRSVSEPFLHIHDNNSELSSYHQHASNYCDLYNDKEYWCSNYARNRLWATYYYSTHYPVMFYPNYSHYSKRKGGQVRFTPNQTDALEKRFVLHKYLSPEDRRLLADSLKLSDRQVKTWFQNRRAKWRRCSNSTTSTHSDCLANNNSESEEESCTNKTRTNL